MRSLYTHDEDDAQGNGTPSGEAARRASLYGIASCSQLPSVRIQPSDARSRTDLRLIAPIDAAVHHDGHALYEQEMEDRKYAAHRGVRPAMDQSHPLQDLYTTVPTQIHGLPTTTSKAWRVGNQNNPQSDYHGAAMRGVFEPTDSVRERLVQSHTSTPLAYPAQRISADEVKERMIPYDEKQAREVVEEKLGIGMNSQRQRTVPPWSPASHATLAQRGQQKQKKKTKTLQQRHAVRPVASPLKKMPVQVDERCIHKRQQAVEELNTRYQQLQTHADRHKDPGLRYSLPVEDPQSTRAYRLGLDVVPSSLQTQKKKKKRSDTRPPILFRPKSAVALRMDTTLASPSKLVRSSSVASLGSDASDRPGLVAGAKRRPHSASVCYLGNSTVYCMDPPDEKQTSASTDASPLAAYEFLQQQHQYGAAYLSVLMKERSRRRETQEKAYQTLTQRGVLHQIPIPQLFARLRREALKNLTRRAQYSRYEKMALDDYMSLCGMAVLPSNRHEEELATQANDEDDMEDLVVPVTKQSPEIYNGETSTVTKALEDALELRYVQHGDPPTTSSPSRVYQKRKAVLRPHPANGNNSSTVAAMRSALTVTREQFHIALETFNLAASEINMLFSAMDLDVTDRVTLWEVVCAVERLQDGHEELRRSRVQVKARNLPKELEGLRQSIAIPHRTHVPLPMEMIFD
ncbi:hypothetical protein Poli38472_010822 [Pythium oligandrum]|uniref:Uncharacterized protein n=1 Tax=Pythium oligandrum TaxID=41045 RepID=A0A8K1CEW4_PYTOL|nr:hypothetical protein Poli38472_010822 [Pythium oligandrum]|eukprot:TMW61759.1 hypothetical protein Poli38472_010822 [Pythium oligandrum]